MRIPFKLCPSQYTPNITYEGCSHLLGLASCVSLYSYCVSIRPFASPPPTNSLSIYILYYNIISIYLLTFLLSLSFPEVLDRLGSSDSGSVASSDQLDEGGEGSMASGVTVNSISVAELGLSVVDKTQVQCSTVQYSAVQYSTLQCSAVQ